MVKRFANRDGFVNSGSVTDAPGLRSLAALGAALATAAAVIIATVLALFAAATVTVIALMTSVLLGFAALATRARRTVRAQRSSTDLIEARHQGGHHWVAYGWSDRR